MLNDQPDRFIRLFAKVLGPPRAVEQVENQLLIRRFRTAPLRLECRIHRKLTQHLLIRNKHATQ